MGLDFASFLLRYHRNLYYDHFSDDIDVVSRIKRAETFRAWADIEDLAIGYEKLSKDFNGHQKTASAAFRELRQYCDSIRNEAKTMGKRSSQQNVVLPPAPSQQY